MNADKEKNLLTKEPKPDNIKDNIASIMLYALSLATALGFNDLILTIFDGFSWTAHIISKTTYVVIMFGLTIASAYYLGTTLKS